MRRAAWLAMSLCLAAACRHETYFCDEQSECDRSGIGGVCEPTGYCSFPDAQCDTERRYGTLAPMGLAGTCVPQADVNGSSSTGPDIEASSSAPPQEASTGEVMSETGTESTRGADVPACCASSCSPCEGACTPEVVTSLTHGESRSLAVVDETVLWGTGVGRDLYTYDLATEELSVLASLPHSIGSITADDRYVYYLSPGEGSVGRIDRSTGQLSVVADPGNGAGAGIRYAAGSGHLAVDDDNVYFALHNTFSNAYGGAFVAPKNPVFGFDPLPIGNLERPFGIDVDEDFIFVSDSDTLALHRFDRLAPSLEGIVLGTLKRAGPVHARPEAVYAADDGRVVKFMKDGSGGYVVAEPGGRIGQITSDSTDLYVTDIDGNTVSRVPLDGDPATVLSESSGPWGVAVSCDAVFWSEYGSRSLIRLAK